MKKIANKTCVTGLYRRVALALLPLTFLTGHTEAAPITTFNTGVNTFGVPLVDNALDPHYTLIAGPTLGAPFVATSTGNFPISPAGPWLADNSVSAWIAPSQNTIGAFNASYTYETTFDLTGFNVSSATFGGQWAEDDFGGQILLNGFDIITSGYGTYTNITSFTVFSPFTLTSGFLQNVNTLAFVVTNRGGGPTGLRVEYAGTANSVPEPASLALVWLSLACLGIMRLRKAV